MESVLRGEKEPSVISKENPILFFPVRHHSPACAFHLRQALEAYEPDCVLVEGPQNAQEMIPTLTHSETSAPIALYYFYKAGAAAEAAGGGKDTVGFAGQWIILCPRGCPVGAATFG